MYIEVFKTYEDVRSITVCFLFNLNLNFREMVKGDEDKEVKPDEFPAIPFYKLVSGATRSALHHFFF